MSGFDLGPLQGFDAKGGWLLQGDGVQGPGVVRRRAERPLDGGDLGSGDAFGGVLADSIAKVKQLQDDVRDKTQRLALGEDVEVHDLMMSVGKSEVAFNLMIEVRNKLVDAWEKLSRSAV